MCLDFPHNVYSSYFLFWEKFRHFHKYTYHMSSWTVPVIIGRYQSKFNFFNRFLKNTQLSNFIKILPVRIVFDVRKSVHHHKIQTIQPTRCNSFTSLLLDVYVWLNLFPASPHPSSGAYNCTRSLWFYRWREVARALLVVDWPDHDQQRYSLFLSFDIPRCVLIKLGNRRTIDTAYSL
jgi:hypothetical protein